MALTRPQRLNNILFRVDMSPFYTAMDQFQQIVDNEQNEGLKRDGERTLSRLKAINSRFVMLSAFPFSRFQFQNVIVRKLAVIFRFVEEFKHRSDRLKLALTLQLERDLLGPVASQRAIEPDNESYLASQSNVAPSDSQGDEIIEEIEEVNEPTAMESSVVTISSVTVSVAERIYARQFWTNILENLIPRQVTGSEDAQSRDSEQDHADPLNEKWVLDRQISSGAYGTIHTALSCRRKNKGYVFVVKMIPAPAILEKTQALENECRILEGLRHRNILLYLGSKNTAEGVQLYTEYVAGTISDIISALGAITELQCMPVVKQVGAGTAYLHEHHLVHRDIKGANILINDMGCIKLADFGTAKWLAEPFLFEEGSHVSLKGTVYWMSPEIVAQRGEYTGKADIWSIGCLIIEMITGTHPWPGQNSTQAFLSIGSWNQDTPSATWFNCAVKFVLADFCW